MAGTSLLALIDDIAVILDDIAVMSKVAAKQTAGVLGDDLALNAQQVTGVSAERELPVVWAVGKGAFYNKVILIPIALLISTFAPFLVAPLLMLGGAFLCYEGFHKVYHKLAHPEEEKANAEALHDALMDPGVDLKALEKQKISGAIRTDFILSAEIIVIALGSVEKSPFATKLGVLIAVGIGLNFVVYGLVAGIVKLDDLGLKLQSKESEGAKKLGGAILAFAPMLMKTLGVVGTAAMFLVGGGIIAHNIPPIHHGIEHAAKAAGALGVVVPTLLNGVTGIIVGGIIVLIVGLVAKVMPKKEAA